MSRRFLPETIISGGQTGADRAGLDAALSRGIAVDGFMPRGALAEDGRVPAHYGLRETSSSKYSARTLRNLLYADATLILYFGDLSGGTLLTYVKCLQNSKPVLLLNLRESRTFCLRQARAFLRAYRPKLLNIAGPRESKSPGIYGSAFDFLLELLG